jgi:hypothetical protein
MGPFDIEVSTVSWIDRNLMSSFSGTPSPFSGADGWLDFLCYGMSHTANPEPPDVVRAQKAAATLAKKYRSFTTFSIQLQIGADGKFEAVRRLPNSDLVSDPGYTPPFDSDWELWKGLVGTALLVADVGLPKKMHEEATRYSPGEISSLSQIVLPGAQWQNKGVSPLAYSSIKVNPGEVILGHSLIKFRAGTVGDYIGVVGMGCPNHIPWVWCETILAYKDSNNLVLYGAGSAFPCHAFYVDGRRKGRLDLTKDRSKLKMVFTSGLKANISWSTVVLPDMVMNMITGIDAQAPTNEGNSGDIITKQRYTAPANAQSVRVELPIASLECWR